MIGRKPFRDLVRRQLALFEEDNADLLRECAEAERAYDRAERDEAEERYGDYLLLVEDGTERLADLRDTYARTLDDDTAAAYEDAFHREVARRFPRFAASLPGA